MILSRKQRLKNLLTIMLALLWRPIAGFSLNGSFLRQSISCRRCFHILSTTRLFSSHNLQPSSFIANTDSDDNETIFALSSGQLTAASGVAVWRISGPDAPSALQKLSVLKTLPKPRHAVLRTLQDPITHQTIDQALVLYFPQPHSFTGQDVVELHTHGSRAVTQALLKALSAHIRYAQPGEFTYRAWLNGKLDLLQVEALADLLAADTDTQRVLALQQLAGTVSQRYQSWRERLVAGLAHAEAVIDFGDDEMNDLGHDEQNSVWGGVVEQMRTLQHDMSRQLAERGGEILRDGIPIVIVGPPNAGKSSLFNVLAQREAAIVSPTAGTTRDVLEIVLNLGGIKCILQDTAGMRTGTEDVLEQEGMKRALTAARQAELVVVMVDATEGREQAGDILDRLAESENIEDDREVVGRHVSVQRPAILFVQNKNDLLESIEDAPGDYEFREYELAGRFAISCKTQEGVDDFLEALAKQVKSRIHSDGDDSTEDILITRARHRQHMQAAVDALARFDVLSQQGAVAVDMAAEELRLAASELGRITGAVDVEDVLDKLFADFCIGK